MPRPPRQQADFALGSVGAGLGATTANFKGGLGSASAMTDGGVTVAALAAVNAVGSVTVGDGPWFWAAPFEVDGEFGGRGLPASFTPDMLAMRLKGGPAASAAENTTLARRRHRRRADQAAGQAARDDRAYRIGPRDLSRARAARWRRGVCRRDRREADRSAVGLTELGMVAANVVARAIARGVYMRDRAALSGRAAGVEGSLRLGAFRAPAQSADRDAMKRPRQTRMPAPDAGSSAR